ncbi:MAG: hypothetical protein RJQ09_14850 [Cyclobacteriaceae bacterium]
MENLTGTWEGEYSINIGTDEEPNVEFHAFQLKLIDKSGELTGTAHDLTLSEEPSTISGFRDNDIVSFIKKYTRLVFAEDGEYYGDETEQHPDIHYSGTFNIQENCYQGTWEIHENEEREGLQDEFEDQYFSGNWYMRRTK